VDIREAQESIDSNVERIDRNIQAIAAISSGSVEKIEAIDVAKLIRDQCDLLRPRCSQAGITLEVGIPTQQEGNVNAMTFTSLIVNLVQNAVEALETQNGDKPKRIKVTLTKIDDKHVLEVLDNGPGIDGEIRPKVFRRFASKKTGGWGVGLYHCSLLVKSHGGLIDFTSRPGLGTNFRAELPDG
jgi:signal transduction histidine kinase